jgi:hypothetical protein
MVIYSQSRVFCDHLTVTCSPDDSFLSDFADALACFGCPVLFSDRDDLTYRVGSHGTVKTKRTARWHLVSVSGSALRHFRSSGEFEALLSAIAAVPHTVTRLDVSSDVFCDFPEFLDGLDSVYPDRRMRLTRKSQPASVLLSPRLTDGRLTGTYYVGKRGNTVSLAVYDKQQEALDRRGESLPPTTRVELRVSREVGATLRDAVMPESLFYHYVPSDVLPRPDGVAEWSSHAEPWQPSAASPVLDYQLLKRRIDNSPELGCLVDLAGRLGPEGLTLLQGAISRLYHSRQSSGIAVDGAA